MSEEIIVRLVFLVLIPSILLYLFIQLIREQPVWGIVKLPKAYRNFAIFCLIASIIIICIPGKAEDGKLCVNILFGFAGLGSIGGIVKQLNFRIIYDDRNFVIRNLFGKEKQYSYNDITSVRRGRYECLFMGPDKIEFDRAAIGVDEFLQTAQEAYRAAHDQKSIPRAKRRD